MFNRENHHSIKMTQQNQKRPSIVLVVEDSKTTADQVTIFLQTSDNFSCDIIRADSLSSAFAKLEENTPDVVLLDLGLPDSFGLETFVRFKQQAPTIPTVIYTGVDDEETALEAVRIGAQDYLVKGTENSRTLVRSLRHAIDRKKIEEALRERTALLVQTEKLSALGELTAGVVHEINQPLNAMKIACEDILLDIKRGRFDTSYCQDNIQGIITEITKIAEIVDQLRRFSTKSTGNRREILGAAVPVERVVDFLRHQFALREIEVTTRFEKDLFIRGDLVELQQVFVNLITNAIRAMEEGPHTDDKKIHFEGFLDTDSTNGTPLVVYEISDNGPGMPREVQKKVFEPFFTTQQGGKGTGLGLSLVLNIIEEHEGSISVKSTQGKGTTFRILLPSATGTKTQRHSSPVTPAS